MGGGGEGEWGVRCAMRALAGDAIWLAERTCPGTGARCGGRAPFVDGARLGELAVPCTPLPSTPTPLGGECWLVICHCMGRPPAICTGYVPFCIT